MKPEEIWRDIAASPKFQISDHGRVRNKRTKRIRNGKYRDGYVRVVLNNKCFSVHRLVAQAFLPADESRPIVNHKDSVRDNNHVSNLEWVTHSENSWHASRSGRLNPPLGSRNGRSVLTESDVDQIRQRFAGGESKSSLARSFNCSWATIYFVVRGDTWKHLPKNKQGAAYV